MIEGIHNITAKWLGERLEYAPGTGNLTWKARPDDDFFSPGHAERWRALYVDKPAGTPLPNGQLVIGISQHGMQARFMAHHLVWVLHHGRLPRHRLKHVNGNKSDNRIENLREAAPASWSRNRELSNDPKKHIPGISWNADTNKWTAKHAGKTLGSFKSRMRAVRTLLAAEARRTPLD